MKKLFPIIFILVFLSVFLFIFLDKENSTTLDNTSQEPVSEPLTVTVTIPEGYTAVQIAEKLQNSGVCSADAFIDEVQNIQKLKGTYKFAENLSAENKAFALEGYIFPDTYEFYKNESAETALSRFLKNTESKLTDEYYERAEELGFSLDEIITLASIVQKEAGFEKENAKVASVLYNRIKNPSYGKLQCDVTIAYLNDFVLNSPYLTDDTERFKELYNTYKCSALPAGAICNPGMECIKAALYPESTSYYFFVTDDNLTYYYNETYEAHIQKCKELGLM